MRSLIETTKLNGIGPEAYHRVLITRIADHSIKKIDEQVPWNMPRMTIVASVVQPIGQVRDLSTTSPWSASDLGRPFDCDG
ncbi:transposase domain-containing protein [Rhizobium mayense]|uniref:transposase domain-containing protein n=1 Tax=Rhizobium mayense TaxID=1312184 RepID=UPI003D80A440